jgi:hypothetical protein
MLTRLTNLGGTPSGRFRIDPSFASLSSFPLMLVLFVFTSSVSIYPQKKWAKMKTEKRWGGNWEWK